MAIIYTLLYIEQILYRTVLGQSAYHYWKQMHIPAQADQSFWSKSTTDSGAFHPVIPLGSRPLFC